MASALALGSPQALPENPVSLTVLELARGGRTQFPDPKARLSVVVFLEPSCPIGNRMGPELGRISREYAKKDVRCWFAYVGSSLTGKDAIANAEMFDLQGDVVLERGKLAAAIGATVTPEAAVVRPDGKVVYRGRINDLYLDHARQRSKVSRHDLRLAIDELLAGRAVSLPVTVPVGCFIPQ